MFTTCVYSHFPPDDMNHRGNWVSRPHFTTGETEAHKNQVTCRSLWSEFIAESVFKSCSPDSYPRLFLYTFS